MVAVSMHKEVTEFQYKHIIKQFYYIAILQVYKLFQPLMLCLSHSGTLNAVDKLIKNYDAVPQSWRDNIIQHFPVSLSTKYS